MNERLTLPARRFITPVTALLMGIALLAAVALGFGLRAWTETPSAPSTTVVTPSQHVADARDEAAIRTATARHRAEAATDATTPLVATRGHR